MLRGIVSRIMLTLLVVGTLTLAFDIQLVKSSGTIYIRADGSVDPPTAPISSVDNVTYVFTANVYDEIVVERSNITVDGNQYTLQGSGSGNGFCLFGMYNVTIKNASVNGFFYGAYLNSTSHVVLSGNTVTNNTIAVEVYDSSNCTLAANNVTSNKSEIELRNSDNNNISKNDMSQTINYFLTLINGSYNTIAENNMTGPCLKSIILAGSSYNIVSGNRVNVSDCGIDLSFAHYNIISGNNVTFCTGYQYAVGVLLADSSNNIISENNIMRNWFGIAFTEESAYNKICHNSFSYNMASIAWWFTSPLPNSFDDGYPSGGNYWGPGITLTDLYRGPYQNESGSDGIGDTEVVWAPDNVDHYPLTKPYGGPHDIGITSVDVSKNIVGRGYNTRIKTKVINYGISAENFNVVIYATGPDTSKHVINVTNVNLIYRNSTTFTFIWNTGGFAKANYTISTAADTVPGETYTTDNTLVDGWVVITIPGDVNGDGTVDIFDAIILASCFGQYCSVCDFNDDGVVDIFDAIILAANFGQTDP